MNTANLVLAMTGASGALYGLRLLQTLLEAGQTVHFTLSPCAAQVLQDELNVSVNLEQFDTERFLQQTVAAVHASRHSPAAPPPSAPQLPTSHFFYHHCNDFRSELASGSFLTAGMVICPCSMATLGRLAHSSGSNLIHRAADVHLKERRPLILVPRETPLSVLHLDNMRRLAEAGCVVLPAMPGFYHRPTCVLDLVDFVVARICDHLNVPHSLVQRWKGNDQPEPT